MAGTKTYSIKINGITESVDAIKSLEKELFNLEERIKSLEKQSVNIKTSSSGGGGSTRTSNVSSLNEEASIQREINKLKAEGEKLDAKIAATQDEIYKRVDATKQLYKETVADQKALAAAERLQADAYSNTMQGMKSHLADLKAVINTTDLGDGDKIKKMTEEANKLNEKLLEIEKSYGQFGRQVGNYEKAANGFKGLVIQVGNVKHEFDSAKQAAKELGNELKTLQTKKDLGLISPEEAQRMKDLVPVVAKLKSSIADAGKPMDALMDGMRSFVALAQVGKGLGAFFGLDNDEIEKSIQKLVGLQNAMQGLQQIQAQLNSAEGIGGWLSKANDVIDGLAAKITGAKKAQDSLNASTKAGKTASDALTASEVAQTTATEGATIATKGLSLALKTIGIGLVITAVATLITYWKDIVGWFKETIPELKVLGTWFDKLRAVVVGVGTAIANYMIQPIATLAKLIAAIISGASLREIAGIITDGFKKTFNLAGNYQKGYHKEVERQQKEHNEKVAAEQKKANEELLKDEEAKYGKSHKRTQEYLKKQMALTKKGSKEYKELQRQLWEDERQEREDNAKKGKKDTQEAEKEMAAARISEMKEGLNKTITQLEEERKQRLAKLSKNMRNYKSLEKEINDIYNAKILKATEEWNKKMEKANADMWLNIRKDSLNNSKGIYEGIQQLIEIQTLKVNEETNKLFNQGIGSYGIQGKNQLSDDARARLGIISTDETDEVIQDYKKLIEIQREYSIANNNYNVILRKNRDELEEADNKLLQVRIETSEKLKKLEWNRAFMWDEEYEKERYNIVKTLDQEEARVQKLRDIRNEELEHAKKVGEAKWKIYEEYNASLQQKYDTEEKQAIANYTFNKLIDENYSKDLQTIFKQRISAIDAYWSKRISNEKTQLEGLYDQQKTIIDKEYKIQLDENIKHWNEMQEVSDKAYQDEIDGINAKVKHKIITQKQGDEELLINEKEYQKRAKEIFYNYKEEEAIIEKKHAQDIEKLNLEKNEKIQDTNKEFYENRLQNLRDFQTAINNLESKQPVRDAWGMTNQKETQKNFKNLKTAYESFADELKTIKAKIKKDFDDGLIDKDVFESTVRETENMSQGIGEALDELSYKMSNWGKTQTFFEDIQQYFQEVASSLSSILNSIWEGQNARFEQEMENLQKQIDKYGDLLDKQKDLVEKHADKVNSIEDELSTARGDRRQHLIDQLNAEMAAQRQALAEQKKIEKQEQALKDKKEKEELEQKKRQQNQDALTAAINAAMAISMAAANKWPVPAIPLMAMAAAVGAAQIAAIKAVKYAKGGLLEGKSHAEGGIPVGNTGIEVEGHEYVIRKKSTTPNIDLLDYINKSERKLDLDDFIEFYSSGKLKKNIVQMSPSRKFAEGGTIPTLNNDYSFNDRLLDAFEDYSNRPVVVSVKEILNTSNKITKVETLAGLHTNE